VVLLAIGSLPSKPPVPGIEQAADSWDVLEHLDAAPSGKEIVIIGGGTVGCETAQALIEKGNHITIIEMTDTLAGKLNWVHWLHNKTLLEKAGSNICLNSRVEEVAEGKVIYTDADGQRQEVCCDMVICATGQRPLQPEWADELICEGYDTYTLGDATMTGDFRTATRSAMDVIMSL